MRSKLARLLALFLCLQLSPAYANELGDSGFGEFGKPGFMNVGAVVNNLITPFFSVWQPVNNTSTFSGGFALGNPTAGSGVNAITTVRRVPMPFGATLSSLSANLPVVATTGGTGATVTTNINGVAGNLTCAYALVTPFSCSDTTHTDVVNAGDLIQYTFNPHGGTWAQTAATPGQISVLAAGAGQQGGILTGASNSNGVVSTTAFDNIGSGGVGSATELASSGLFSVPGQITSLYVIPNAADTAANVHTYTVFHNGVSTALSCVGAASTAGCCVDVISGNHIGGGTGPACGTATALTIAAYDTVSVEVTCGGTCATVNPAFGLGWQPSNKGQVPLFAVGTNASTTVATFVGVSDGVGATTPTTQVASQIAPALTATMTFSNYGTCQSNAITGAATRTATLQSSTSPSSAPTTPGSGPTVTYGVSQPCPGANSGALLSGLFDTTHTLSASANYLLDSTLVPSGVPAGGFFKISMAVTVP